MWYANDTDAFRMDHHALPWQAHPRAFRGAILDEILAE
jgi:hypothetical protein